MDTIAMHTNLSVREMLDLANQKTPPSYIRTHRIVSNKRAIYTVRSDFLYHYTVNWYFNRCADNERVLEIMKSIERESDVDNRIYSALWTDDDPKHNKLLVYDGNHRREALVRLYSISNKVFWVDIDVLINATNMEVRDAFNRINKSISVPESYLELQQVCEGNGINVSGTINNPVARCEAFVKQFQNVWKSTIRDKQRTTVPYCTKNDLVDIVMLCFNQGRTESDLMDRFLMCNETFKKGLDSKKLSERIRKSAKEMDCYIFIHGVDRLKRLVLP